MSGSRIRGISSRTWWRKCRTHFWTSVWRYRRTSACSHRIPYSICSVISALGASVRWQSPSMRRARSSRFSLWWAMRRWGSCLWANKTSTTRRDGCSLPAIRWSVSSSSIAMCASRRMIPMRCISMISWSWVKTIPVSRRWRNYSQRLRWMMLQTSSIPAVLQATRRVSSWPAYNIMQQWWPTVNVCLLTITTVCWTSCRLRISLRKVGRSWVWQRVPDWSWTPIRRKCSSRWRKPIRRVCHRCPVSGKRCLWVLRNK